MNICDTLTFWGYECVNHKWKLIFICIDSFVSRPAGWRVQDGKFSCACTECRVTARSFPILIFSWVYCIHDKDDYFRQHKVGLTNFLCYHTFLEIIINNSNNPQYDILSQLAKVLEYFMRKERKKISLYLLGSHIYDNFRPI